jgi:uncharacterized protein (TIGR02757 family)
MRSDQLRDYLDLHFARYNQPNFIKDDPISIPHQFHKKQDIEIAGFIAAVFSWGNRLTIINKSNEFLSLMDQSPHDFIRNHEESDLKRFLHFKHRTFQPIDALYFIEFLSHHYKQHDSLENAFHSNKQGMEQRLIKFNQRFFALEYAPSRTRKHVPTPERKSTCKRLNMFLRWMVRNDQKGVDFGIWNTISASELLCPIDVHVSNVARGLGLLNRTQNDWKAVIELTDSLRKLDPNDPVKYDFALFGLGVTGEF